MVIEVLDTVSELGRTVSTHAPSVTAGLVAYSMYRKQQDVLPAKVALALPPLPDPLPQDRIVFLSPHPDDETLAGFDYLRQAQAIGAQVSVILITDGNKHGLKQIRAAEFHQAIHQLGLTEQNYRLLHFADGTLPQNKLELEKELRALFQQLQPTIVVAPHTRDIHRDHRATGRIASHLFQEDGPEPSTFSLYQYLIHFPPFFPWPRKRTLHSPLTPPARLLQRQEPWYTRTLKPAATRAKEKALRSYSSQLRNPVLRSLMYALVRRNELFTVYPATPEGKQLAKRALSKARHLYPLPPAHPALSSLKSD